MVGVGVGAGSRSAGAGAELAFGALAGQGMAASSNTVGSAAASVASLRRLTLRGTRPKLAAQQREQQREQQPLAAAAPPLSPGSALAAPLLGLGLDAEVPLTSMGIAGAAYVVLASVLMAYACRQERNRR